MGVSDYLKCDVPLPNGEIVAGFAFDTKSLFRNLHRLTITAEGRLIHHACRYEHTDSPEPPYVRRIELGDVDLDYHGDILLRGGAEGQPAIDYVARFTDGKLEWIRPLEHMSDTQRILLMVWD